MKNKNFISNLVVITGGYPSPVNPIAGVFVQQLVHAMARQGVECIIINPIAIHHGLKPHAFPYHTVEQPSGGPSINVIRPRFLSLSAREKFVSLGRFNPGLFTFWSFTAAVKRIIKQQQKRPDALYGHFLYMAGAAAVRIGKEINVPSFPCVGEGSLGTVRCFGTYQNKKDLLDAAGFLANSSYLKKILIKELDISAEKIDVFPNGIDSKVFYPRNKLMMRKKYNLPEEPFLAVCVGNYIYDKGPIRVAEAINGLKGVGGVFIGSGPLEPKADNIFYNKRVPHDVVPELLSAADTFVLPTLIEGSSNAIVEAMACGLPIISSEGEFNDDLLTEDMSIRVNPLNVAEIREAVLKLKIDAALRQNMSSASLDHARSFDINTRAKRILHFMQKKAFIDVIKKSKIQIAQGPTQEP